MAMANPIQMTRTNLLKGDYHGVVVDNKDPKKQQRVRIRVPQLHRNIPDNKLPWSMPDASGRQANAGVGVGGVDVPPIGSKVMFSLTENDPHNPKYKGSPTTDDVNKNNELLNEDYPGTYGQVDHAGNKATVNTEKNEITTTHVSGTTTHTDGAGNVSIVSVGNITLSAKGNITIVADGVIKVHAKGNLSSKGAVINLNSGDGAASATETGARTRPNIPSPAGKTTM